MTEELLLEWIQTDTLSFKKIQSTSPYLIYFEVLGTLPEYFFLLTPRTAEIFKHQHLFPLPSILVEMPKRLLETGN